MSTLTVLRVENHSGVGPYRTVPTYTDSQALAVDDLGLRHSDWWRQLDMSGRGQRPTVATHPEVHPGPFEDRGMKFVWERMGYVRVSRRNKYIFGFGDESRLRQWFFGERDTLELLNMHVAAYEVPHQAVIRGDWQLAFRKPSARLVRAMTLQEAGVE